MKTLFSLLFLLCLYSAHAECYYSNYELKLEITTTEGEQVIGYQTISKCDFEIESIHDQTYLQSALVVFSDEGRISLFRHRMEFKYCLENKTSCKDGEKASTYHLVGKFFLPGKQIESVRVLEYLQVSSLDYISTPLQLSDTNLLHMQPLQVISFGAYLCFHTISVFQESKELNTVLGELTQLQAEIDSVEVDGKNGDRYDEQVWKLIAQLSEVKGLIAVSECSD